MPVALYTAPIWYHGPSTIIGQGLSIKEKYLFLEIKNEIHQLFTDEPTLHVIFNIVRLFNNTDVLGMDESIPVLRAVIKYVRHLLLDVWSPVSYLKLVQMIDALVRKCGIRAHVLIGRKRFLQTLSLTARRWSRYRPSNTAAHEAADFTFDCLQAWHEAFYDLRAIFPEYQMVYHKLVWKYRVQFPREEDDPSRIPIVLEQADDAVLLQLGPEEFLLSEQVNTGEGNPHVPYSVYGSRDSFHGGFTNQDELRAIEKQYQVSRDENVDVADNASYHPVEEKPTTTASPLRRPALQQVVSQRSFQLKRSSLEGDGKASNFQILASISEDGEHDPHLSVQKSGSTENKEGVDRQESNVTEVDDEEQQSVTIENRAMLVDGRLSIGTRAVVNSGNMSQPRKSWAADKWNPADGNMKDYDPTAGKAQYDHYKSDQKTLKSVPSHLYNQKSVKQFSNIEDRIERFNSRDSSESQKMMKSNSSSQKIKKVNSQASEEDIMIKI